MGAFVAWLLSLGVDKPLIGMEATGAYSIPLADFLVGQGYAVSVINPAKVHAFAKSELSRAKTDKAFCLADCPLYERADSSVPCKTNRP